jgi:hypothetical protein
MKTKKDVSTAPKAPHRPEKNSLPAILDQLDRLENAILDLHFEVQTARRLILAKAPRGQKTC